MNFEKNTRGIFLMNIKVGDKVKYIGTEYPKHKEKLLGIKSILPNGLVLHFPKVEGPTALDGRGNWHYEIIVCDFDDVEHKIQ